jgi:hypothetical protein
MPSHVLPSGHPWRGGELDQMLAGRGAEIIDTGKHLKIRVPEASDLLVVPRRATGVPRRTGSLRSSTSSAS